jgi:hypothetical protein
LPKGGHFALRLAADSAVDPFLAEPPRPLQVMLSNRE